MASYRYQIEAESLSSTFDRGCCVVAISSFTVTEIKQNPSAEKKRTEFSPVHYRKNMCCLYAAGIEWKNDVCRVKSGNFKFPLHLYHD